MLLVLIVHVYYYSLGAPMFDEVQQEPVVVWDKAKYELLRRIRYKNIFIYIFNGCNPSYIVSSTEV